MLTAMLVAACGGDAKDTKIADIDFANPAEVQKVAQRLAPDEREAFAGYARSRQLAGNLGIKEIVTAEGRPPDTVADAINLTRKRQFEDRSKREEAEKRSAVQTKLMDEMQRLTDEYNAIPFDTPDEGQARRRALEQAMKRKVEEQRAAGIIIL
jgi:hypothetical protein